MDYFRLGYYILYKYLGSNNTMSRMLTITNSGTVYLNLFTILCPCACGQIK